MRLTSTSYKRMGIATVRPGLLQLPFSGQASYVAEEQGLLGPLRSRCRSSDDRNRPIILIPYPSLASSYLNLSFLNMTHDRDLLNRNRT